MTDLIRRAQNSGWLVLRKDPRGVVGACPREGCGVTVLLTDTGPMPSACTAKSGLHDIVLSGNEDARVALRARRQMLGFSLHDMDEITGLTVDHVAKAENQSKRMGMDLLVVWAAALGYDVVLRPKPLPPLALRVLSQPKAKRA